MSTYRSSGYIAISSVLIIMVVVLLVGMSVTFLSVDDIKLGLSHKKSEESLGYVEGCVDDALLTLNKNNSLPATIVLPEITCTVSSVSQVGNTWSFVVTGSVGGSTKKLRINADRNSRVILSDWMEMDI